MDLIVILSAGVATGTVLLFATIGEIIRRTLRRAQPGCGRYDADRRYERLQCCDCHRESMAGLAGRHAGGRAVQPDTRVYRDHPASRPGRQRVGPDVFGHRHQPGAR